VQIAKKVEKIGFGRRVKKLSLSDRYPDDFGARSWPTLYVPHWASVSGRPPGYAGVAVAV